MDDPRRAAVAALMKQERSGYANLVLRHALDGFDGGARERAFFSAVFYGTVERMVTLDWLLQKFLKMPLTKLDAPVRAILRSGLYQARYLDSVPVHAAVNESVALTRRMGKASAAGMVNAVLRRAAGVDLSKEHFPDEITRLSVTYSVSPQLTRLLSEKCPAQCEGILQASFIQPSLCVRVNTLQTDVSALEAAFAAEGVPTRRGHVPNSLYVSCQGDIAAHPLFQSGAFHVQGEASQLACAALCPKPGDTVLDLCAAPGGKSATLAQYMQNTGTLIACDAAQNRLPLVDKVWARLGVLCGEARQNDASVYAAGLPEADAVLCDVPCSGLGVLAKKPDIRLKTLEGLPELVRLQRAILETASRYVKPGGRLVYSTCTLNPDENAGVVRAFLAQHPGFCPRAAEPVLPGATKDDKFLTLYPQDTGTDGFFIALLERL
ncbi:MAG: 16S rRNA (cytosine(967)-C(5))-methyltransferase RsmB [Subdoligranulum sp.]|nr:16S rRNA (cytosine(967)-C(5))-methyltransferase RsmB [Subdoligranulum sp.]